jgi:hypothetical protein
MSIWKRYKADYRLDNINVLDRTHPGVTPDLVSIPRGENTQYLAYMPKTN